MIDIKVFTLGPFAQHPYLVWDDESLEAYAIDPGYECQPIVDFIKNNNLKLKAVINTHAHLDHLAGVAVLQKAFDVPFYLHNKEEMVIGYANKSAQMYGLPTFEVPKKWIAIKEGDEFSLGKSIKLKAIETPGHTPGGICFYTKGHIFVGDTLFEGSVGRTDLPGGNSHQLKDSLERLKELPEDTVVYSGHGELTTIGQEKKTNPFLR